MSHFGIKKMKMEFVDFGIGMISPAYSQLSKTDQSFHFCNSMVGHVPTQV